MVLLPGSESDTKMAALSSFRFWILRFRPAGGISRREQRLSPPASLTVSLRSWDLSASKRLKKREGIISMYTRPCLFRCYMRMVWRPLQKMNAVAYASNILSAEKIDIWLCVFLVLEYCSKYLVLSYSKRCKRDHRREEWWLDERGQGNKGLGWNEVGLKIIRQARMIKRMTI